MVSDEAGEVLVDAFLAVALVLVAGAVALDEEFESVALVYAVELLIGVVEVVGESTHLGQRVVHALLLAALGFGAEVGGVGGVRGAGVEGFDDGVGALGLTELEGGVVEIIELIASSSVVVIKDGVGHSALVDAAELSVGAGLVVYTVGVAGGSGGSDGGGVEMLLVLAVVLLGGVEVALVSADGLDFVLVGRVGQVDKTLFHFAVL